MSAESDSNPLPPLRPLALLLALQLCWLVTARLAIQVGWGFGPAPLPNGMVAPGWMTNLTDHLGYATFLHQARWGEFGTSLLYTTTPHPAVYFNPVLWGLGRLADLTNTRPEGWLILAGMLAALLTTAGIYFLGHLMGGRTAALYAAVLGIFGSGWTWIQRFLAYAMGWNHFYGSDLRYMDMLPASAGLFYPLHVIGAALMAWVFWLLLRLETAPPGRRRTLREIALVHCGVLLSWARPYEPAIVLGIYGLYVAAGLPARAPQTRWRIRGLVLLFCAVAPGLFYAAWVALQPIWYILSSASLSWGKDRAFWLQGFGGLWLVGGIGALLWRRETGPARLAVIWFCTWVVLMLVLNIRETKLFSAAGLAFVLVAGRAFAELHERLRLRLRPAAATLGLIAAGLVFAGPFSLLFALRESILDTPRVDAGLWRVAERVRDNFRVGTPTVLTEHLAGGILPGIIGARVLAGHWVLTDDRPNRQDRLRAAGLESDSPKGRPTETLAALQSLLHDSGADFLLMRDNVPATAVVSGISSLRPIATQDGWSLFAFSRPTP